MRLFILVAAIGVLAVPALAAPLTADQATIVAWGDSLTLGVGAHDDSGGYPGKLSTLLGVPVFNGGNEGASSKDIARHMAQHPSDAKVVLIWSGRSDVGPPAQAEANIAGMVASLKAGQHYLVLGLPNTDFEPRGSKMYDQIVAENADLAKTYGDDFVDVRGLLMASGANADSPEDADDLAKDIPPKSVRWDPMHPNDAGYQKIANAIAKIITERGWLN